METTPVIMFVVNIYVMFSSENDLPCMPCAFWFDYNLIWQNIQNFKVITVNWDVFCEFQDDVPPSEMKLWEINKNGDFPSNVGWHVHESILPTGRRIEKDLISYPDRNFMIWWWELTVKCKIFMLPWFHRAVPLGCRSILSYIVTKFTSCKYAEAYALRRNLYTSNAEKRCRHSSRTALFII